VVLHPLAMGKNVEAISKRGYHQLGMENAGEAISKRGYYQLGMENVEVISTHGRH
jgi:isopentenyldiphosphate isomerase